MGLEWGAPQIWPVSKLPVKLMLLVWGNHTLGIPGRIYSGPQLKTVLPSFSPILTPTRGHLAMSGDIFKIILFFLESFCLLFFFGCAVHYVGS